MGTILIIMGLVSIVIFSSCALYIKGIIFEKSLTNILRVCLTIFFTLMTMFVALVILKELTKL